MPPRTRALLPPAPPPPPLTTLPEIFTLSSNFSPFLETHIELETACSLLLQDTSVDILLRDHIINHVLRQQLCIAGNLAKAIIDLHAASDSGSVQSFVEIFNAGMRFFRTADENQFCGSESDEWGEEDGVYRLRSLDPTADSPPADPTPTPSTNQHPALSPRTATTRGPHCEITGDHGPAANLIDTPIFPTIIRSSMYTHAQQRLWQLLQCIYPTPLVSKIAALCDPTSETARFKNGIVMSASCRRAFRSLQFYLFPLVETFSASRYDAAFYWTAGAGPVAGMKNFRWAPRVVGVGEEEVEGQWCGFACGERITFRTRDAARWPLPDPALLYAHMVLARMALPMEAWVLGGAVWGEGCWLEDEDRKGSTEADDDVEGEGIEAWMGEVPEGCGLPVQF